MSLFFAILANYFLQKYLPQVRLWQSQYALLGKKIYQRYIDKSTRFQQYQADTQQNIYLFANSLPYLFYVLFAIYLQICADLNSLEPSINLGIGEFISQLLFVILGVVHLNMPDETETPTNVASQPEVKELYLKTFLPLILLLLPWGYILLALYFNVRFLLHQNILHLPLILEDIFEQSIHFIEEKSQLILAAIFAITGHQDDVWRAIRWKNTVYQDFLYQILLHASPMVTKIDFENQQKSHVYKNTTLILKRALAVLFALFILRGFFN